MPLLHHPLLPVESTTRRDVYKRQRYSSGIELNAVQRANAEMQKRAYNVVRCLLYTSG